MLVKPKYKILINKLVSQKTRRMYFNKKNII